VYFKWVKLHSGVEKTGKRTQRTGLRSLRSDGKRFADSDNFHSIHATPASRWPLACRNVFEAWKIPTRGAAIRAEKRRPPGWHPELGVK
jgi:hypothetical protein